MSDSDNEIGAFLTGFILGGLVGAAVALITAPQSGEETRAQIRGRSIEIRDRAVEPAEEARRRGSRRCPDWRVSFIPPNQPALRSGLPGCHWPARWPWCPWPAPSTCRLAHAQSWLPPRPQSLADPAPAGRQSRPPAHRPCQR